MENKKPKIYLSGHIHIESKFEMINDVILMSLDSSSKRKEYAIFTCEKNQIKNLKIVK